MQISFDANGLVPAVAQDATSGAVLMVAWMNAEALALTQQTKQAHFWSRSRKAMWRKGETSGHTLAVREIRVDCDADTILLLCDPAGPACHTGKASCFHRDVDGAVIDDGPRGAPAAILDRLARVIDERRRAADADASYTKSLLAAGMPKILGKIAEEQGELAAELSGGAMKAVVHETADLILHVLVGLAARDIDPQLVFAELERRFGTSGHAEKAARPPKHE